MYCGSLFSCEANILTVLQNKLSHVRRNDGAVQPGNMGFHVKTLDEIRAEKRKRKSEEKPAEEKAQSMSVNI